MSAKFTDMKTTNTHTPNTAGDMLQEEREKDIFLKEMENCNKKEHKSISESCSKTEEALQVK